MSQKYISQEENILTYLNIKSAHRLGARTFKLQVYLKCFSYADAVQVSQRLSVKPVRCVFYNASLQCCILLLFKNIDKLQAHTQKEEIYPFSTTALEDLLQHYSFTSRCYTLVIKHLASQVSLNLAKTSSLFQKHYFNSKVAHKA